MTDSNDVLHGEIVPAPGSKPVDKVDPRVAELERIFSQDVDPNGEAWHLSSKGKRYYEYHDAEIGKNGADIRYFEDGLKYNLTTKKMVQGRFINRARAKEAGNKGNRTRYEQTQQTIRDVILAVGDIEGIEASSPAEVVAVGIGRELQNVLQGLDDMDARRRMLSFILRSSDLLPPLDAGLVLNQMNNIGNSAVDRLVDRLSNREAG